MAYWFRIMAYWFRIETLLLLNFVGTGSARLRHGSHPHSCSTGNPIVLGTPDLVCWIVQQLCDHWPFDVSRTSISSIFWRLWTVSLIIWNDDLNWFDDFFWFLLRLYYTYNKALHLRITNRKQCKFCRFPLPRYFVASAPTSRPWPKLTGRPGELRRRRRFHFNSRPSRPFKPHCHLLYFWFSKIMVGKQRGRGRERERVTERESVRVTLT